MTESPEFVRVAQAGLHHVSAWRRGALGNPEAYDRWRALSADAAALADAQAAEGTRIAIMGRVKAGKSTLINGLLGTRVAGTHAFETSAAIHQIRLASDGVEYGQIERGDVVEHFQRPEELADAIEAHRGDQDYWRSVDSLESQVQAPKLPSHLVFFDTPGVATLTQVYAQRATDFLNAAHIVIWVQNGMSLGNAEDERYLNEIARRGLPIIIVVTRADHLDEDEEAEAREWFAQAFPGLSQPVFTAANCWSSGTHHEDREALISILAQLGADSETASREVLKADLIEAAQIELGDLAKLDVVLQHVADATLRTKQKVLADVRSAVLSKVDEVLSERSAAIARHLRRRDADAPGEALKEAVSTELGDARTAALLRAVEQEAATRLDVALGNELRQRLKELEDAIQSSAELLDLKRLGRMREELNELAHRQTAELSVGRSTVVGGAATATGYVAWIGAGAAKISIGSALTGVGLPIVLGGAALILWKQYKDKQRIKRSLIAESEHMLAQYREYLLTHVIEARFFPALEADVHAAGDGISAMLLSEILGDVSRSAIEAAGQFFRAISDGRFDKASSPETAILVRPC